MGYKNSYMEGTVKYRVSHEVKWKWVEKVHNYALKYVDKITNIRERNVKSW